MAATSGVSPGDGPIVKGVRLISPKSVMPDRAKSVFPFPFFNVVQTSCFTTVYASDENLLVSAPTASGKTVVLELAICRLAFARDGGRRPKVIYLSPTKSLCSERHKDWQKKFSALNLSVQEFTGDTEINHLRSVLEADVIVTTPEKWDSVTRKWEDNSKLVNLVELVLIDEIHFLNQERGATLEAVISRMKYFCNKLRLLALSATIPNADDIATWLGRNREDQNSPAICKVFGEDFRPVKLEKHVIGLRSAGCNEYVFDKTCTDQYAYNMEFLITRFTQAYLNS